MARLCDIVKEGVEARVQKMYGGKIHETVWRWDGKGMYSDNGQPCLLTAEWLFSDGWLLSPTVADVLRERGYVRRSDSVMAQYGRDHECETPSVICPPITSPAEAVRICDFLDSLSQGGGK